jgi:hypothetical protein
MEQERREKLKIQPKILKKPFLNIFEQVQVHKVNPKGGYLYHL